MNHVIIECYTVANYVALRDMLYRRELVSVVKRGVMYENMVLAELSCHGHENPPCTRVRCEDALPRSTFKIRATFRQVQVVPRGRQ